MKEQTLHIIGSLIEMTGQRDRELIAISLVKTLFDLLFSDRVELYEVEKQDKTVVLKHLAHMDDKGFTARLDPSEKDIGDRPSDSILEAINKGEDTSVIMENGEIQSIIPIHDEKERVTGLLIHRGSECLPEHQKLIKGVLQLYQNFRSLVDNSQRDPMTGLLNRETFVDSLSKIMGDARLKAEALKNEEESTRKPYKEEEFSYWLGLFDIDHFKKINDTYGHLYGDEVILLVVKLLKETFRKDDLFFRYGGEEFIAVICVPNEEDARNAFERLREAIANYTFGIAGHVTISIGYIRVDETDLPLSIVGKADKALYFSKENGRNQAHNYQTLLEEGLIEGEDGDVDLDEDEGFESF